MTTSTTTGKWTALLTRSNNLLGTALDNKANNSVSDVITFDNTGGAARHVFAFATLRLGSITPSSTGSVTLRVYYSDGVINEDISLQDGYFKALTSGTGVKNVIFDIILKPCVMRFVIVNNSGTTVLPSEDNGFWITPYGQEGNSVTV